MQGADDRREEVNLTIDQERSEDMEVSAERTSDDTRIWADVVQESHMRQPVRASYSVQLHSEIESFDKSLPSSRLGELSAMDQQRFFRLNGIPDRPCSARFFFERTDGTNCFHGNPKKSCKVYPTISHRTG